MAIALVDLGINVVVISTAEFARRLAQSRLVSEEQIGEAIARVGRRPSADPLANDLIARGLLTAWQAKQIAARRFRRLIMDGRYRLLDKLGEGAMGAVFKAFDERMRRQVALKVPRPESIQKPEMLARFEREVVANGLLQHPGIVRALDVGKDGDVNFLVMEFVEGIDLSTMLDRNGPIPIPRAIDYAIQVAEALDYAVQHGVIHRDLKPANLLITRDGKVKILDLGLARILDGDDPTPAVLRPALTKTGMILGTVAFMAPEQAENTHRADIRSDIYSLGCAIYDMLTGTPPFTADNPVRVLLLHQRAEPKPIPGLDPKLWAILAKMLAKKPDDRQQTPAELLDEIRRWQRETNDSDSAPELMGLTVRYHSGHLKRPRPAMSRDIDGESTKLVDAKQLSAGENGKKDYPDWLAGIFASSVDFQNLVREDAVQNKKILYAAIVACIALVSVVGFGLLFMSSSLIVIDWPLNQRTGAVLKVDGMEMPIHEDGPLLAYGRWGRRHIVIDRPEYQPIDVTLDIGLFARKTFKPPWIPARPPGLIAAVNPPIEQVQHLQQRWSLFLDRPLHFENGVKMKFVLMPPGSFTQGTTLKQADQLRQHRTEGADAARELTNEMPARKVEIADAFYLCDRETTVAEFRAFIEATGYRTDAESSGKGGEIIAEGHWMRHDDAAWNDPGFFVTGSHPVAMVSWRDAAAYCQWLRKKEGKNYRLPTEAEWEYACRAGSDGIWSFGDLKQSTEIERFGWTFANAYHMGHPGGQKLPNPLGLFDMHGNLAEWCADAFAPYPHPDSPTPAAPTANPTRVIRGGGFQDTALKTRCTHRIGAAEDFRRADLGFRVAIDAEEIEPTHKHK